MINCGSQESSSRMAYPKQETLPKIEITKRTVYIRLKTSNMTLQHEACSGVSISSDTIVTTAHCFEKYGGENVEPEKVYFGPPREETTPTREIASFTVHPDFFKDPFYKDIAIIKIKGQIPSQIKISTLLNKPIQPGALMLFQGLGGGKTSYRICSPDQFITDSFERFGIK